MQVTGAARRCCAKETGAEVWAPAQRQSYMINPEEEPGIRLNYKFGRYPPGFKVQACPPDHTFCDGDRVVVGNIELQLLTVQGHTKDSTCFFFEVDGRRALLTGDVVFYGGRLGIQNLEGFSFDDYRRDIHKLADLEIDMLFAGSRGVHPTAWPEAYRAGHPQVERLRNARDVF